MAPHCLSEEFDRVQASLVRLAPPILRLIVVGVGSHQERRAVEVRGFEKSIHFEWTFRT